MCMLCCVLLMNNTCIFIVVFMTKLSCFFSISLSRLSRVFSLTYSQYNQSSLHEGFYVCYCLLMFVILFMVQQVKSRTKPYAYGMYWKQNRKQCIAFLALDSQLSMEAHMKWVELQIQNLETYRRGKCC